jgi:hypothetical protein
MPIKHLNSTIAAPTPAQRVRDSAKRKINSLEQKTDQARQAKKNAQTVDKRRDQNNKIRDSHQKMDTVRVDRDKQIKQLTKNTNKK